jgi:hypothetical protein
VIVIKLDHNIHHEIYIVLLISSKALQVSGRGVNVATVLQYSINAACSNFPLVYVHQMYVETEFSDFIMTKEWPTSLNDNDISSEKFRPITCISHLSSTKTKHQISYINEWKWPDLLEDRGFKTRERKKSKSLANVQYQNCGCHLSNPQDLERWKVVSCEHSLVDHRNEETSSPIKCSWSYALEYGGPILHTWGNHIQSANIWDVVSNTPSGPAHRTNLHY